MQYSAKTCVQRNWKNSFEISLPPARRIPSSLSICMPNNWHHAPYSVVTIYILLLYVIVGISVDGQSLFVISESKGAPKPWALAQITYEDGLLFTRLSEISLPTRSGKRLLSCTWIEVEQRRVDR